MPIISPVGRNSLGVRIVFGVIYVVLGVGAVSMIYPLMLMLSGSVKSDTDYQWITPVPTYLWDDDLLWKKYIEAKYAVIPQAEISRRTSISRWQNITTPQHVDEGLIEAYREFRAKADWPTYWYSLGQSQYVTVLGVNARRFQALVREKYPDLAEYSKAVGVRYASWSQVGPPATPYAARRFTFPRTANYQLLDELKRRVNPSHRIVVNLDGIYWMEYLRPQWPGIEQYNAAHGTRHASYQEVFLNERAPQSGQARSDWEQYVRNDLNGAFIRIASAAKGRFARFLSNRYDADITQLNAAWSSHFKRFDEIPLPAGVPESTAEQTDCAAFIRDAAACPLEMLSVEGPRQGFERFVAARRGVSVDKIAPLSMPIVGTDYADFKQSTGSIRWELFIRNYIQVIDYLLLNGNGLRNTLIYCALTILATLTINPLAAYAMSRYRPPSTYKVLLFCMCTMAFPGEVTMIPSFLLLKRFPLFGLAVSAAVAIGAVMILMRWTPRWPAWIKGVLAGSAGLLAGFWLLPSLIGAGAADISLLNTFWALVIPGAANGFGIFLLKGFFDSLPQELYEAAEIDGAGEVRKFLTITMSLSKPILAVLALGAFTAAYSEFMMALVIIPDPDMWTLMVWLFQLQSQVHPTVVYASLVVAAIPTFLVFLFCQNLIMRGIVVPVEK